MPLIDLIAGARPNFMKIAPIIRAMQKQQGSKMNNSETLKFRLIHTGQHYDEKMSASFFKQLEIPSPDVNLEVGSGSQAEQTALIMMRYESLLREQPSDLCLVVGDVNSTMATAITAQKMHIQVAHVEAGIRSGDWSMPEEINRLVTDSISNWFFTTSTLANENLIASGVDKSRIFFVGNTMIDTLLFNEHRFTAPEFWQKKGLVKSGFLVLTLHRPSNVDDTEHLKLILDTLASEAGDIPILFPVHPRTKLILDGFESLPANVITVDPQPYLQFNFLVKNAMAVITDSGGITEEATVMNIPCMTLRDSTERPETVTIGTNLMLGTNPENIAPAMQTLLAGKWKKGAIPELWDGQTGPRIIAHLETILA